MRANTVQTGVVSGKSWVDGAFFGELPMLGLGAGDVRNQHQYSVEAVVESSLTYLRRVDMESLESDFPEFKTQVRQLAAKRATRFGIEVKRVTMTVQTSRRRHSVALDPESMAEFDPELARAFGSGSLTGAAAAAAASAEFAANRTEEEEEEEEDDDGHEGDELPATVTSTGSNGRSQIDSTCTSTLAEAIMTKLSLLENKVNHLQATMAATVHVVH